MIRRTTLSLLRNFPSKRGARSSASIWKNSGGIIFISGVERVSGYSGLTRTARALEQCFFSRAARRATGVVTLGSSDSWSTRLERRGGVFIDGQNQKIFDFFECVRLFDFSSFCYLAGDCYAVRRLSLKHKLSLLWPSYQFFPPFFNIWRFKKKFEKNWFFFVYPI